MMNVQRYRDEVRGFVRNSDWKHPFAVTLTLRQVRFELTANGRTFVQLTRDRATRNFRHFLNLLSAVVYGKSSKRFGRRVRAVPVLEGGLGQRLHYHAIIDCPRADLLNAYPQLIEQCWQKTDWGYDEVRVTADADEGWLNYITKLRSKSDFAESIDWMNVRN